MIESFSTSQEAMIEAVRTNRTSDTESYRALSGIEFKQTIPVLKDTDVYFDKHWRNFTNIIDCHVTSKGGTTEGVRPYDVLTLYKRCLPEGSTRLRLYSLAVDRARKKGRLPHDAALVIEEIKKSLKKAIKETPFQK